MNRTDSLTVLGYDLECYHLGIIPSVELPSGLVDGYLEICRRSRLSIRRWANVSCTANFSLGGHPVGCDHLSATRIQAPEDQKAALLSLEAAVIEIQRATILGDCSHDLLRRTVRNVGLYLQSQL